MTALKTRTLVLVFALALPVAALATFPVGFALRLAGAQQWGLSATEVAGSIWHGRLQDAQLHSHPLGDLRVRLQPWPWLAGVRAVRVDVATVRGRVLHGRRSGIDGVTGAFELRQVPALAGLDLLLHATDLRILFDGDRCIGADGQLRAAILAAGDAAPRAELAGDAACAGRTAVIEMAPVTGHGALEGFSATLRVHGDGAWDAEMRVAGTPDAPAQAWLQAAGFQPGPAGWSRLHHGDAPGAGRTSTP